MKHITLRPPSWNTLTVGQFLDLYRLAINTDQDEMTKAERAVSIIYNKTEKEVEELKMGEFSAMSKHAAQFLTIKIPGKAKRRIKGGKRSYRIIYDPTKLRQRQYVEVLHFCKKPIENMHLVLASIVKPVRFGVAMRNKASQHIEVAADLLNAKVRDVYHTCVFFCRLYSNLIKAMAGYLEKELMTKGMSQKEASRLVNLSLSAMDGFIQQPELQSMSE